MRAFVLDALPNESARAHRILQNTFQCALLIFISGCVNNLPSQRAEGVSARSVHLKNAAQNGGTPEIATSMPRVAGLFLYPSGARPGYMPCSAFSRSPFLALSFKFSM